MKKTVTSFLSHAALALSMLVLHASPASAEYDIQLVSPDGALFTQTFGINNAGTVTGGADDGTDDYSFTYDMKSGEYTIIDYDLSLLEISNSGVMVGSIDSFCAIRDRKGVVTLFTPPSAAQYPICQARGISSNGEISGFQREDVQGGDWIGFRYDPKQGSFEEFLPSSQTFAHAINARGQIAGSTFLDANEAYAGSPPGRYGYVREKDGTVKYFEITQAFPGSTRARGISESGLVAGFYEAQPFVLKSFVTTLSKGAAFDSVTLDDDEVIYRSPCNPDQPSPGPEYVLFTNMTASQVRNDGVVVGSCVDFYVAPNPDEDPQDPSDDFLIVDYGYGFIATPVK